MNRNDRVISLSSSERMNLPSDRSSRKSASSGELPRISSHRAIHSVNSFSSTGQTELMSGVRGGFPESLVVVVAVVFSGSPLGVVVSSRSDDRAAMSAAWCATFRLRPLCGLRLTGKTFFHPSTTNLISNHPRSRLGRLPTGSSLMRLGSTIWSPNGHIAQNTPTRCT